MPVVGIPVETLATRLGEPRLGTDELVGYLKRLGCDVEGWERVQRVRCIRCGTLNDCGPTGEPPAACDGCGLALREVAGACEPAGELDVVRIDLLPVRPDMLDPGGLARAVRHYLGRATEPAAYPCASPRLSVTVEPAMADRGGAYRPFIACAVVRGLRFDAELIPVVMKLQENLHWAMGRDRKLASIGIYDLATVEGETLRYRPVGPDEIRFVPLMCDPSDPDSSMTPRQVLERHPKGVAYADLLSGRPSYPLLEDARGGVLSMPPIINSEATRVRAGTADVLVDVTGLSERLVHRTLTVTATSLLELVPGARLEAVEVRYADRVVVGPLLEPDLVPFDPAAAGRLLGVGLGAIEAESLLRRMGHGVRAGERAGTLLVEVPAYRNDVMHEVDLVEDVAMARGYDSIEPTLVRSLTVGEPRPIEELSSLARRALAGLGLLEMVTLPLTSEEAAFDALGLPRREDFVSIANPASVDQTMLRESLLPGLLEALRANIRRELPHRIFEVGDVSGLDPAAETGARERRHVAIGLAGSRVGLAEARSTAEALLRELGRELVVRAEDRLEPGLWIAGRATALRVRAGLEEPRLGVMGEVHPAVIERFGLRAPVALVELDLELLKASPGDSKTA